MQGIRTAFLIGAILALSANSDANRFARAAAALDALIAENYAYLDQLPDGELPQSDVLTAARNAVHDDRTLLAYAEKRVASLADHHAITGSSFDDSWAIIPTYTDLWIEKRGDRYLVDAVRNGSPAKGAAIQVGDRLINVDGIPIEQAISAFWADLGLAETPERANYAARVLVAGRRDRARRLTVETISGTRRQLTLPSLYEARQDAQRAVSTCTAEGHTVVRFNNSLGDFGTIAAFDNAMRSIPESNVVVLDLRNTPSGGNTTVARAIMGWFVDAPRSYQVHNRPTEFRETGVARQWIEQVLPRAGMYRAKQPVVVVGRWTGSMGEGIAVGFAALGADVRGSRMAGLKGAIEDLRPNDVDLTVKIPTEVLLTPAGQRREDFVPAPLDEDWQVLAAC